MSNPKNIIATTATKLKDAAKDGVQLKAGKTVVNNVTNLLLKRLPAPYGMMLKPFATHPLGKVVIATIISGLVDNVAPEDIKKKLGPCTDAGMAWAMFETSDLIKLDDIWGAIAEGLKDLPNEKKSEKEED